MTLQVSNAAACVAVDAQTALVDGGTLVIYSGTKPTDTDTALGSNDVLITFTLADPAFGAAVDANPNATATANAIDDTTASASGTATFFRIFNDASDAVLQGTVTASGGGGDCIITSTSVESGAPASVISLTVTQPE